MVISFRELHVIVERILLRLGIPPRMLHTATRTVVSAEVERGAGLAVLEKYIKSRRTPSFDWAIDRKMLTGSPILSLDALGASCMILAPAALDLAIALAADEGWASLRIRHATDLALAVGIGERATRRGVGLVTVVIPDGHPVVVEPNWASSNSRLVRPSTTISPSTSGNFILVIPTMQKSMRPAADERGYQWASLRTAVSRAERDFLVNGREVSPRRWAMLDRFGQRAYVVPSAASREDAGPPTRLKARAL